jgi:hypothetical protein
MFSHRTLPDIPFTKVDEQHLEDRLLIGVVGQEPGSLKPILAFKLLKDESSP